MYNTNFYAKEYSFYNQGYDTTIISNISDIKNSNIYKLGDLLHFSNVNYLESFFVGKEGKLIRNMDYTDEGNLLIPYEITQHFDNSLEKYKFINDWYTMELGSKDKILVKYLTYVNKDYLYFIISNYFNDDINLKVIFPNKKTKIFQLNKTTINDIDKFYEYSLLPQIRITVLFQTKKINNRPKLMIPITWTKTLSYSQIIDGLLEICYHLIGPANEKNKIILLMGTHFDKIESQYTYIIEKI
jgi:hypothetical protein